VRRWLASLLVLVAACGSTPAAEAGVALSEFAIDASAHRFASGPIELRVSNEGDYGHTLVVTDADGGVVSAGSLLAPGVATTMTLTLAPGVYDLTCRIIGQGDDGSVIDHYQEGMHATIVVEAA
jgi:hypothetical protein